MLVKEILPAAAAAVVGANFTLKLVELPAFTFTGVANPLIVKAADPLMLAWEIVRVPLPGLETVTVCVLLLPTVTFPNAAPTGFSVICGAGATTSAVMGMLNEVFAALLVKLTDPEAVPVLLGVNVMVMPSCAPPAKVVGVLNPLRVNKGLEVEPAEIVMVEVPGLVSWTVWCAAVPMVTLPNAMDVALLLSWPASLAVLAPLPNRAHPETKLVSTNMAASAIQPPPILILIDCPRMSLAPSATSASPSRRALICPRIT